MGHLENNVFNEISEFLSLVLVADVRSSCTQRPPAGTKAWWQTSGLSSRKDDFQNSAGPVKKKIISKSNLSVRKGFVSRARWIWVKQSSCVSKGTSAGVSPLRAARTAERFLLQDWINRELHSGIMSRSSRHGDPNRWGEGRPCCPPERLDPHLHEKVQMNLFNK